MNRPKLMIVLAVLMAITANNCGGGGGGGSGGSNDNGSNASSTQLSPLTQDLISCIPTLNEVNPDPGVSSLESWEGWDPMASGTVLGKLFDTGTGGNECIYSRIQVFGSHLGIANEFADKWESSGTYREGNVTASVDTGVSTVNIPYLDFPVYVDKHIILKVPDEVLTIHLAFTIDGNNQTIVEQYEIGNEEAGAYYTEKDGKTIRIWHALIKTDQLTTCKAQFMWEGNTDDKSFMIAECTNGSGGNWEVIGGGDTNEMAFMARNDENNSSEDEYYIAITPQDLLAGTEQAIMNAQTYPPNGVGILAYITGGNPRCFGFLGEGQYPNSLDELAWIQE